ncbi:MAG: HEAT repeat domain-containing protein [Lentisphaeria bacterium]|nr:HEAT repeat domain-containing protein [Lentisphaeria bacterium]
MKAQHGWWCGVCLALAAAVWAEPAVAVRQGLADLRSPVSLVRIQAARALGRLRAAEGVGPLCEALGDADAALRRESARSLGLIRSAAAVPHLVTALSDRDANVRFYAAYALGEIGDTRAVGALRPALSDPVWNVRDQAAWALREIAGPGQIADLVSLLESDTADLPHIRWLLAHAKPPEAVVGPLAKLASHPRSEVRLRAVETLVDLGGKAVVPPLIEVLRDPELRLRRLAAHSLIAGRDERSLAPLRELAARESDAELKSVVGKAILTLSVHPSLQGYWSFDDRSTETARDVTGRGSNGEIKGCTPVEGKSGSALRFENGAYIELDKPPALAMGQTPFTVMAWVNSEAPNGVVMARGGAFCGFSLYIMDGKPKFGIHLIQDGPAYIAAGTDPVVGRWVHLAGVMREDRIELLVDGSLAASAKTPGLIPGNAGQGMEIGFDVANSPAEICTAFQGIIDEVMFFGAALEPEDIRKQAER